MNQYNKLRPITSLETFRAYSSLQTNRAKYNGISPIKPSDHITGFLKKKPLQRASWASLNNKHQLQNIRQAKLEQSKILNSKQLQKSIQLRNSKMRISINMALSKEFKQKNPLRRNFSPFQESYSDMITEIKKMSSQKPKVSKRQYTNATKLKKIQAENTSKQKQGKLKNQVNLNPIQISQIPVKQKNIHYQYLRKGSTINKKIISSIIRKKLANNIEIDQKIYPYNQEIAKQYDKIIPLSFQDVIGKREMIRMAKIFKGIPTKQIQIQTPAIHKRRQFKLQEIEMVDFDVGNNTIRGWELLQ